MRFSHQLIASVTAAVMLLSSTTALADTTKHERVYVVASPDGNVVTLTDNIRLENADALEEIRDATRLQAIQNVSGKETFTLDGEVLTWQAKGGDITYQGTSDRAPSVLPVVMLTLDGEEIAPNTLEERTGDVTLTVSFPSDDPIPALAVAVLPLPEGISDLHIDNGSVLTEMGQQILLGYAVTGMDDSLSLPSDITATFHADHAALQWMMTFVSSDPISALCQAMDERIDWDLHLELDEAAALARALARGDALPETTGQTKGLGEKLDELNRGLTDLDSGAASLAEGAHTLSDGVSDLSSGASTLGDGAQSLAAGLQDLKAGSQALDSGAQTLKDGLEALNSGSTQIGSGAEALLSGSEQLTSGISDAKEGADALVGGLSTLQENNDTLSSGAQALFTAILDTANSQLAASGLEQAGITFTPLTQENYAAILDALIAQLDPDTLKAAAYAQVESAVRAKVQESASQVRAAVEEAVQEQVLSAVLAQSGLEITSEQYAQAVEAGAIEEAQSQMISAALESQMASETVQQSIEEKVTEQMEHLVSENVQAYLAGDETLASRLESAVEARESLITLKAQLSQVEAFVSGLKAYTDGVSQLLDGAGTLSAGLAQLHAGAETLQEGASSLSEGTTQLTQGALQARDGARALAEGSASLAEGAVHASEGADALAEGTATLLEGTRTLYDGSLTLAEGADTLQKEGTANLKDTLLQLEKDTADKLLPYLEDELPSLVSIFEDTRDLSLSSAYDLRPEEMQGVTVYIIRTDLK